MLFVAAAVVLLEVLLVGTYILTQGWSVLEPRYVAYPWIWINTGLFAVWVVDTPEAGRRTRMIAGAVAAGYLLVIAVVAGIVSVPGPGGYEVAVFGLPPGWGPVLVVGTPVVAVTAFPYEVVGYTALAFLVYVVVLRVSRALVGAVVGVVSCVSCSVPVAAALIAGGGSGVGVATSGLATDLSTVAYLLTVLVLVAGGVDTRSLE